MLVSYTLIIIAAVVQFILGAIWYSPLLFGKFWMKIMGGDQCTPEDMKRMQKEMMPFYGVQFIITLIATIILALTFEITSAYNQYLTTIFIWLGFMLPTQISSVIWANTKREFWLKQITIMAGCQLIGLLIATWILI